MRRYLIGFNVAVGLGWVVTSIMFQNITFFTAGIVSFQIATFLWWQKASEGIIETAEDLQLTNERIMQSNYELRDILREYQFIFEEQQKRMKGQNNAN